MYIYNYIDRKFEAKTRGFTVWVKWMSMESCGSTLHVITEPSTVRLSMLAMCEVTKQLATM